MNDEEFAVLMGRARGFEERFGFYPRNDYVCAGCLAEGNTEAGSTYLDYPADMDAATGDKFCGRHAEAPVCRPTAEKAEVG